MTSFTTRTAGLSDLPPDPTKHVNFSFGMVLGVDDLKQEFAYLAGRDQWLARDLLGYGTAVGLKVSTDYDGESQGVVEVEVEPGAALSPRGQLIRVATTQCADLNGWLAREDNRARADSVLGEASDGELALYVVLSYRACATDNVPIPGEPCRSEEESMAASRLADNYRLELTYDAPDQREEQALRDFVRWLEQVNITHEPGGDGFASLKDFEAAVRDALQGGVPPASLRVDTGDACEYLRAAFRVWATELRPKWVGVGASAGVPPTEEGVLLAELGVPVVRDTGGAWVVAARSSREVEVREERRPYLLHLRMVQEWIECGRRVRSPSDSVVAEISFGQTPSPGTDEAYSRADHTHGTPALEGDVVDRLGRTVLERIQDVPVEYDSETATDGQLLTYSVVTEEDLKREIEKGEERDEVRRRFEAGARWRPADLRLQGARVAREQDAGRPTAGQVLTYVTVGDAREGVWQASDVVGSSGTTSLSGDATGPTDQTVVQAIQGTPIIDFAEEKFAPQPGQVLTFVGPRGDEERDVAGQWVAADPQAQASTVTLGGDVTGQSDRTRVSQIQGAAIVPRSGTTPFANGDVLTFRNGNWVPLPPPTSQPPAVPNLEGDVVGPVGSNSLRGIKGFPVLSRQTGIGVATYEEGDVLVFRDGQWVPEAKSGAGRSGEFVERPAGLPPYSIVAAGIVSHNGGRFPVYNNLNLRVVGNGLVTVGFDGYKVPDDTFQYIVKALPVFNPELRLLDLVVEFDSFLSTDNLGFRLRVTSGGQPVDGERLQFVELMIEVSRYEMTPKE